MKHVGVGIAFIVIGVIVVALQPALKRSFNRNGQDRTGVRVYGNVVVGIAIAAAGVAIAAGAF